MDKTKTQKEELQKNQDDQELVFKLTSDGNYDLENKKMTNVAAATGGNEAVTKRQLDQKPDSASVLLLNGQNHMTGDLDLRGNKLLLPREINMRNQHEQETHQKS